MASDGVNTLARADAVCDRGFFRGRVLDQDHFIKPRGFSRRAAVALARRSCDARVGSATTCLLIGDANWNEHSIVRGWGKLLRYALASCLAEDLLWRSAVENTRWSAGNRFYRESLSDNPFLASTGCRRI
jgi:hypothetical protein